MPTTPSLKIIEGALQRIHQQTRPDGPCAVCSKPAASAIATQATWVWPLGYERRKGEHNGHGGSGISRPTESIVGSDWGTDDDGEPVAPTVEWKIRGECNTAAEAILRAAALLEGAMAALDRAAKAAGRNEPPKTDTPMAGPRLVSKAEVAKAGQMKRWRDQERKIGMARGSY